MSERQPSRSILPFGFGRRKRRRAFTVVEMLIAVGAVALIGVGLAQLFERTGETVRIGRRVSAMNEYAALFERTMRADLQAISRNGFVVIRHREVGDPAGQGIALSPTDRTPKLQQRRRRVDQLAFFTEGRSSSLREPLHPDKHAGGTASRIWYGHGLSRPTVNEALLTDDNQAADTFGAPAATGGVGAAQFAGSWTLLRHQTILARPQIGSTAPTGAAASQADASITSEWADSAVQVGLQPASPTIFRCENLRGITGVGWARVGDAPPSNQPLIASGIVDVASMDLSQVRTRVLSPYGAGSSFVRAIDGNITPISTIDPPPLTLYESFGPPNDPTSAAAGMKDWMAYSLPAGPAAGVIDEALNDPNAPERRIRYEATPPDYLGVRQGVATAASWQRSDQLMLSSSNMIPGCTEFIVEWSFGQRHPSSDPLNRGGQLIWHGLPRFLDLDGDGLPDTTDVAARVADVYHANDTATAAQAQDARFILYPWLQFASGFGTGTGFDLRWEPAVQVHPVLSSLIHIPTDASNQSVNWPAGQPLYSMFGYIDPTYYKTKFYAIGAYLRGDLSTLEEATIPDSIPWAWPTLVRVTMSLVDPSDPDNEQTYQFVFDVPQRPAN